MSNFDLKLNDMHDEDMFGTVIGGQMKNLNRAGDFTPMRTTASQSEIPRKGITTMTVSEILQGAGQQRDSSFWMSLANQSLSSDLGLLMESEGGAEAIMGGRLATVASDVLSQKGFSDGRFDAPSGLGGAIGATVPNTAAIPGGTSTGAGPPIPTDANSILAAGDSVMVGIQGLLTQKLSGWTVTPEAAVGRRVDQLITAFNSISAFPPIVVIIMGHNPHNVQTISRDIETIMTKLASVSVVVWVTVTEWAEYPRAFNQAIWSLANRDPKVKVVDWALKTAGDAGLLADHVHPKPSGNEVLATLIAQALGRANV
jgi:hypothetical protein